MHFVGLNRARKQVINARAATILMLTFLGAMPAGALTLVDGGQSEYVIVVSSDAIPAEQFAAEELALHLEQMSGSKLPIVTDAEPLATHAILLGNTRFLQELGVEVDWQQFGKEGYLLRVSGDHLIIAGGQPRGVLYGVYALIEDHLGCRWFAPDTSFIPQRKTIELAQLTDLDPYLAPDITGKPAFEYRDPKMYAGYVRSWWWRDHFDANYVARTRNSGTFIDANVHPIDERYGGAFEIPHSGHNLSHLVPAELYAAQHPEYFALHEGRRVTEGDLELCLTHPDVVQIAAQTLRQWMQAEPNADMFFIGQSDTGNYCQCERCKAAYERYTPPGNPSSVIGYGGLAGRNLQFVNQVATLLEDEFPNMRIGTFAYGASRNPPANITAHRNVVIWYCPIERCICHPLDRGPINQSFYHFADGIKKWKQIAREVYLYDYSFAGALGPPADLLTIAPTVRAAWRLGVTGVQVDAIIDIQVGFGFLRYWLWAQSLRNPEWDAEQALCEFLDAYYGSAATHIEDFISLVSNPGNYEPLPAEKANIWTNEDSPLRHELVYGCHLGYRQLTDQAIEHSYSLFEQARQATAGDPQTHRHVAAARMVLQFAMLENLPADDPRLKDEAAGLLRLAKELEMRSIQDVSMDRYWDEISNKLGVTISE